MTVLRLPGGQTLVDFQEEADCEGPCPIHRPSSHAMRDWPLYFRTDRGIFERICPHGVGHPDPDSVAYAILRGDVGQGVHGCDGCCVSTCG